jgi:hypothetical protein
MADMQMDEDPKPGAANHPFDAAINAMRNKKPPPQIDFTLHTMEDGNQVSTMDRVCKGMSPTPLNWLLPASSTSRNMVPCIAAYQTVSCA